MKYNLFLILLIILGAQVCVAESNAGSAEYAMLSDKWPCQLARQSENENGLKELRKSVLWNTFGENISCLLQYLKDPRLKSIQFHLINEVCQRNKNCGNYEFLYKISESEYQEKLINKDPALIKSITDYIAKPARLIKDNLNSETACLISPGLESNLNLAAAKELIAIVKPHFPNCKIVWNPMGNSRADKPLEGTIMERHGSDPEMESPCNANLDGVDISLPNRPAILPQNINVAETQKFLKRYRQCENAFLWIAEFNGLTKNFLDPRKRTEFPTLNTFNEINKIIAGVQRKAALRIENRKNNN